MFFQKMWEDAHSFSAQICARGFKTLDRVHFVFSSTILFDLDVHHTCDVGEFSDQIYRSLPVVVHPIYSSLTDDQGVPGYIYRKIFGKCISFPS
jgi:hypothetical protein